MLKMMKFKKKIRYAIYGAPAAVFLLLLVWLAPSLMADGPTARIERLSGQVRVIRGGSVSSGAAGMAVSQNDTIETGPNSRVVLNFRGTEIRLDQNSSAVLENLVNEALPVRVRVNRGFGWFHVRNASQRGFSASTPTAIASVRGTKFSIGGDANGSVSCVCEGRVSTSAPDGQSTDVTAGGSHSYTAQGQLMVKDFRKYFKKLKVDRSFQNEIKADPRLNSCLSCHRTVDLASDRTPEVQDY